MRERMFAVKQDSGDDIMSQDLGFVCPRCGQSTTSAFYGPCSDCRGDLRKSLGGEARVVQADAYEPKMNVVPNQIATKD